MQLNLFTANCELQIAFVEALYNKEEFWRSTPEKTALHDGENVFQASEPIARN